MNAKAETAAEKQSPLVHAQMYFDHHAMNQMDQITSDYNLRQARMKEALAREQDIHALDISIRNSVTYLHKMKGVVPLLVEELIIRSQEDDLCMDADAFMAALLVFEQGDPKRIEPVINEFGPKMSCREGVAVALAWLPLEITRPWLKAFLNSKDLTHKWLACRAFSLMRVYPSNSIRKLAMREDCQKNPDLFAAILYLAGQVRDTKLLPLCKDISEQSEHPQQATAWWSRLLLEQPTATSRADAINFALQNNEHFHVLSNWLVRLCPWAEAKAFLAEANKNKDLSTDLVIHAMAMYGDPAIISWLLATTSDPALMRWLGLVFVHITGLNITPYRVSEEPDYETDDLYLDEDYSLPLTHREKLIEIWAQAQKGFSVDRPYFLGKPQQNTVPVPNPNIASLGFVRHYCAVANTLLNNQPYRYFVMPRSL